jgi:NOL1/NOP2/fmu family ribosome biogenesis protein
MKEITKSRIKEIMTSHENVICLECLRLFDLLNEEEANEWFYGHDCETDLE